MKNDLTSDSFDDALRSFRPMDPTEALRRLQALVQTAPFLSHVDDRGHIPSETLQWLGQLQAIVSAMKLMMDEIALRTATSMLVKTQGVTGSGEIRIILQRALAVAELQAPASEQGAFIAAGQKLDAYASISKVLASASRDLLVIDPYMDGKAITDFMPGATEGVTLRVLADEALVKPSLAPAVENWVAQFGAIRPLEVRLSPARALHDRLILVDGCDVWSLTQSLKDFANRAPGSILKVDAETAKLKHDAYAQFWSAARPI